jgi:Protein of unknown function (DUF2721)
MRQVTFLIGTGGTFPSFPQEGWSVKIHGMHAVADPGLDSLTRLLQLSISPVVLISAVGLLLLSVTNRLGRSIDRSRALVKDLDLHQSERPHEESRDLDQLRIIVRRAGFLRVSVGLLVGSVFCSCLMILSLFLRGYAGSLMENAAETFLIIDLLALLGGVGFLFADTVLSLKALHLEVARHLRED